jgi:hypothetical protein
MAVLLSLAVEAAPATDQHAGWIALAVIAAMVLVACWRYVLYLLAVALVALLCLGLMSLLDESSAAAGSDVPPPADRAAVSAGR